MRFGFGVYQVTFAVRSEPGNKSRIRVLWLLLIPVLVLVPGIGAFPYPSEIAEYSDIAISHYPIAYYVKFALEKWRTVPLWSPDILSGYPLIADPLSSLMYPPGWLGLILPLPDAINVLVIVHLIWGGAGMYFFCREEGLVDKAAIFAALVFESMPKFFAHYGAGHVTLIYAVSWTPWLLYAANRSHRRLIIQRSSATASWEGLILGAIFLADPRWTIYAGLLWWGYVIFRYMRVERLKPRFHRFSKMIYQSFLAGLIASPLAIPLLEFTRLSTRMNLKPEEVLVLSLPPARLLGLFYPDLGGFHEWVIYLGAGVVLLAGLAVIWGGWRVRSGFWIALAMISLGFSLGANLPGGDMLAKIPGINLMRVPPRSLFLLGMAAAILAADGLDKILESKEQINLRRARVAIVTVAGFVVILSIGTYLIVKQLPLNFAWGSIAFLAAAGLLWWGASLRNGRFENAAQQQNYFFVGIIALLLFDLGAVDTTLFAARPAEEVFTVGGEAASFLQEKPGRFRVYSPSYSLSQSTAARARLELVDGVHPLQLADYAYFMEKASGVPRDGYSVSIPPYANGNPRTDNLAYIPDPNLLGIINARFIVSEFDLTAQGIKQVQRFGETRLYENLYTRGPAWVVPEGKPNNDFDNQIQSFSWKPNQIIIKATGPGLLVLSEINYPGWAAFVDGEESEIVAAYDVLRSVHIGEGMHEVTFLFRPYSFYLGLGLAVIGLSLASLGAKAENSARHS